MNLKKSTLAVVINSFIFSSAVFAAPPGTPTVGWGDYTYSLVEIDQSQTAYEKLVIAVHDNIEIVVTWDVWSGGTAQTARILFDGDVVWEGPAGPKSATFTVDKGGLYDMVVELQNDDGVSRSKPTLVTIADTDGSHLEALETVWTENNKPFENKSGLIVGTYFVEWGVYGRNYPVDKMPVANLNRIIYGFVPICGGDGINDSLKTIEGSFQSLQAACAGRADFKIAIHDPWAAIQKPQKGVEGWSVPYKGNFGQLMAAKKSNPSLKILPSIGGWTLSDPFFFMDDPVKRATFVASAKEYLKTWKFFDGLDIDFEFPGGGGANPNLGNKEKDGPTYVAIMRDLRAMLDQLGDETGRYYELTTAISVGSDKIAVVDYKDAAQYLDNIYLMSYDFYGAFDSSYLNHQTALHESGLNPGNEYFTSRGVDLLLKQGVPAEKLVMGVAAYGRGWKGVVNYVEDNPFTGTASGPIKGTWEDGVVDYRDIVNNYQGSGWEYGYDEKAEAPYMFKSSTGDLITYDNPRSVLAKAHYVVQEGLGGIFHWEMDADNGDLVNAMHEGLGHGGNTGQPANRAPIARAGANKSVIGPAEVYLDGSKSTDPEGENLTFKWTQTAGPKVAISAANTATASLRLPEVNTDTMYTFSLMVTDPQGLSQSDDVVITNKMEVYNQPPTVDLQMVTYVNEGEQVTITANGRDQDGDTLSYLWDIDNQFIVAGNGNSSSITLKAPEVDANTAFDVSVLVTDGEAEVIANAQIQVKNIEIDIDEGGAGDGGTGGGGNTGDGGGGSTGDGDGGSTGGGGGTGDGNTGDGNTGGGDGCASADSAQANHPTWDNSTVYTTETVSHNGLVYKAKWWVQGSEPTPSNEAWELLSEVDLPWATGVVYQGHEQVNHNGSRWQAKWWTQGGEPGVDSVWINVGPATCN